MPGIITKYTQNIRGVYIYSGLKKLFENWRVYLNEKMKIEKFVSPRDDKRVLKLINLAEQARATFIKNIFLFISRNKLASSEKL